MGHLKAGQRSRTVLLVLLAVLAAALTACGDKADKKETGQGQSTATTTPAATTPAARTGEFCSRVVQLETAAPPDDVDFGSLSPEQQKELAKKFVSERIIPLADEIQKITPAEDKPDVDVLVNGVHEVGRTGDFEAVFTRPEVEQADQRSHAFDLRTCGWARSDVSAVEYAYQGAPSTLKAGVNSIELANKGKEAHEIVLLRFNDGVTDTVADLVKLPKEEGMKKTTHVNDTTAEVGKPAYLVADLKPGRYAMVCFKPVGGGKNGPPHASKGMFAEVKVT